VLPTTRVEDGGYAESCDVYGRERSGESSFPGASRGEHRCLVVLSAWSFPVCAVLAIVDLDADISTAVGQSDCKDGELP
jgi:hypothetical protein